MLLTRKLVDTRESGQLLRQGKLVAFPTETVFGLGADAENSRAVEKIFEAKGRPSDNPLIVHLPTARDWPLAASSITPVAEALLAAFAPGPLTVILPKSPNISPLCTGGLDSVGIRIPNCSFAQEILRAAGIPIAAPSANRSGRPSCTTWQSVLEDLNGRIDAVFCRNPKSIGLESTVVDCRFSAPRILRPGAITSEQIRLACAKLDGQSACLPLSKPDPSGTIGKDELISPGVRHPHYQPSAAIRLFRTLEELRTALQTPSRKFACCVLPTALPATSNASSSQNTNQSSAVASCLSKSSPLAYPRCFETIEDYAANFYEFLREADRRGAEEILVHLIDEVGIGEALRDRQLRAAGKS